MKVLSESQPGVRDMFLGRQLSAHEAWLRKNGLCICCGQPAPTAREEGHKFECAACYAARTKTLDAVEVRAVERHLHALRKSRIRIENIPRIEEQA